MINDHHRGLPDRSPIGGVSEFDLAMRATEVEGGGDDPCPGCGKPGQMIAHWLPSEGDPQADFGDHNLLKLVIYWPCRRCWKRMRRDETFTAKVEAAIVAARPSQWEDV